MGEVLTLIRIDRHAVALGRTEEGLAALPGEGALRNLLVRLLAASPDDAVRDGERALALGRQLVAEDPSSQNLAAAAMAAAEAGGFDLAVEFQRRAIEAAGGTPPEQLEEDLRRYGEGKPSRTPWARVPLRRAQSQRSISSCV